MLQLHSLFYRPKQTLNPLMKRLEIRKAEEGSDLISFGQYRTMEVVGRRRGAAVFPKARISSFDH
jgi:hypothetical protein